MDNVSEQEEYEQNLLYSPTVFVTCLSFCVSATGFGLIALRPNKAVKTIISTEFYLSIIVTERAREKISMLLIQG